MELRPYQTEAIERIVERGNLLLALTMGAGKSVTAVAAIRKLRKLRRVDNGCIFALKSTKYQWVREINKIDPRAKVQVVDGTAKQRAAALQQAQHFNYTILHYECLVNDWDLIRKYLPIDFVILDECTLIKSFNAVRSRRAKIMGKHTDYRIALSGQPVENRPEELFSIMEWVDADVLGGFHKFDRTFITRDHFGRPKSYKNLPLIHQRLGDAMYRKSREDISEWLPEMIELPMPVALDEHTMHLHDRVRDDLRSAIEQAIAAGGSGNFDVLAHYGRSHGMTHIGLMGEVMSRLLAMRMLSSDPHLLRLSAVDFDTELSRRGSKYASQLKAEGVLDGLPTANVKKVALLEHVQEILAEDPRHKVVVFSYFKPMLAMLGKELDKVHTKYATLTGDTPAKQRDDKIVAFNTNPDLRVFLSSDAGAYGVDLNQGSHLICYDLPWSAGALAQRISRIDRTNSAFEQIHIGYMFGLETIEERMFNLLQQKRKVARAFIDGEFDSKTGGISLDLQSLKEFLDAA